MQKNEHPYTARIEKKDGIKRYYISFTDGNGKWQKYEVERCVLVDMELCRKNEKRQCNFFDRHVEHSELTEESLQQRTAKPPVSLEESVITQDRENAMRKAVAELPEIQQRRFLLYHEGSMTYEQIAERENCSLVAVFHSVDKAKASIRKKLNIFIFN